MWKPREYQDTVTSFPRHQIDLDGKKFFYLPPLPDDTHFVPMLLGGCNLDSSESKFRVEFYCYDESSGANGLGFRFEGPGSGRHDYWHLQMNSIRGWHPWLPGTVPCVPLSAREPVSVLLALIISLYGYTYTRAILDEMRDSTEYIDRLDLVAHRIGQ